MHLTEPFPVTHGRNLAAKPIQQWRTGNGADQSRKEGQRRRNGWILSPRWGSGPTGTAEPGLTPGPIFCRASGAGPRRPDNEAVAFGHHYISNPDLVARVRASAALVEPDAKTFYSPGARGYIDYPTLDEAVTA